MSKIGNKPIVIPDGVKVELKDKKVNVIGPHGSLSLEIFDGISVEIKDGLVYVKREKEGLSSLHGTMRAKINNAVVGVIKKFSKILEIVGVGYKCEKSSDGKKLIFTVGYSHPVYLDIPSDINVELDPKANTITVSGIDKEKVGIFADRIKKVKLPEPYKGSGIKYQNEK
ncbi:MAG: 50S ribosomal protein L6, partial [Elusimicrobiales bacterium]|nr:50S ribosomal protein L6 [Elusimicrobiales bacterium]